MSKAPWSPSTRCDANAIWPGTSSTRKPNSILASSVEVEVEFDRERFRSRVEFDEMMDRRDREAAEKANEVERTFAGRVQFRTTSSPARRSRRGDLDRFPARLLTGLFARSS